VVELLEDSNTNSTSSLASTLASTAASPYIAEEKWESDQHQALVVTSQFQYEVAQIQTPEIESDDEVMIHTRTVGLNPIDWKSLEYNFCLPEFPWITGRELAGVVGKVGSKVKGVCVGDQVWTSKRHLDRRISCIQS